ncbi:MAG: MarR family transcriptional regulator [Elusimicrobia bacterium]|nr:MarR family transcriptional regulator [Elusimicrobiota bacterium]
MPSHYDGSPSEVRALSAFIALMRSADALSSHVHRRLAGRGLTPSQFGVLEALLHRGELCQGELAAKLLRACGSITAVVGGLEKRGLVSRVRGKEDGRFVRVALTPAGRRLIAELFPAHARELTERLGALSAAEQDELRRLCRKLGLAVAREGL